MKKTNEIRKTDRLKRIVPFCLFISLLLLFLSACSQIDCPLNNRAFAVYKFMNSVGDSVKITDTIDVSTNRHELEDSVLINKLTGKSSFSIPMSYNQPEDVLYFEIYTANYRYIDTVWVQKESRPHFESVDCNPVFFHTITGVRTTHHAIDSITIKNKNVTYDSSKANMHIHLRSSN